MVPLVKYLGEKYYQRAMIVAIVAVRTKHVRRRVDLLQAAI